MFAYSTMNKFLTFYYLRGKILPVSINMLTRTSVIDSNPLLPAIYSLTFNKLIPVNSIVDTSIEIIQILTNLLSTANIFAPKMDNLLVLHFLSGFLSEPVSSTSSLNKFKAVYNISIIVA